MIKENLLQPLRIPGGWKVTYNEFMEADNPYMFIDEDTSQSDNFNEDILQIVKDSFVIDLGWYPEHSVNGNYVLYLIESYDWSNPLFIFRSRKKNEIINKLEWLLIHADELKDKLV